MHRQEKRSTKANNEIHWLIMFVSKQIGAPPAESNSTGPVRKVQLIKMAHVIRL